MSAPDPNIRISNAQRETLVARLHAATEEGLLDLDEFAERSRQVYEAKTHGDVERLLADLPEEGRALAVPNRPKAAAGVPDLVIDAMHSRIRRDGDWTVPARITVEPKHCPVTLDCRGADFAADDIEIALDLHHSPFKLILPRNASAVDDGVRIEGGKFANDCHKGVDGPRFHLTGNTYWGKITVRYERRFLWWRW